MLFSQRFQINLRLKITIAFILASFVLVLAGFDRAVSEYLISFGDAGAIPAGAFYTFGMTTPFAMVVVLELMKMNNAAAIAVLASASAATVDCLFFLAVREALEKNAKKLLGRIRAKFSRASFIFPVAGLFVFGLPLPDELGLALMEMTTIQPVKLWLAVFFAKLVTLLMLFMALGR